MSELVVNYEDTVQTDLSSDESEDEALSDEELCSNLSMHNSDRDQSSSDVNIDFDDDYGHGSDVDSNCCCCKSNTSCQMCDDDDCISNCEICNDQCNINNNSDCMNDSGCHLSCCPIDADDDDDEENDKSGSLHIVKHWMKIGKTIFSRWTDGLCYLGKIERIEASLGLCLIRYEDNSLYWNHFKDIHTQLSPNNMPSALDITCNECDDGSSNSPNEIVICDVCNQGYHQLCHKPPIPDSVLEPDMPWTCRSCIFTLAAREGGAEKNSTIGQAMKMAKTMLHYKLESLNWNATHTSNHENIYCYCGGPGRFNCKMLQCNKCSQWFHEACLQVLNSPLLFGDHFYEFHCAICNNGEESVRRLTMKWHDMLSIVLHNLSLPSVRKFFDINTEIIPYIQKNSSKLVMKCNLKEMSEDELSRKILSVLVKYRKRFVSNNDYRKELYSWALRAYTRNLNAPLIFFPGSKSHKLSKQDKEPPSLAILSKQGSPSNHHHHHHHHHHHPPSSSSSSFSSTLKTSQQLQSQHGRSRSPPSYPLMYGAVRKGASIYPKPAIKGINKVKSDSCYGNSSVVTPSTSSTEPNIKLKIKTTMSDSKNRNPKRHRSSSSNDQDFPRRASTSRQVVYSSHLSSIVTPDTSEDEDLSVADTVLEEFIPCPANFEGQNNPFFDMGNVKVTTLSSPNQSETTSATTNISPTSAISQTTLDNSNLSKAIDDHLESDTSRSDQSNSQSIVTNQRDILNKEKKLPAQSDEYQIIRKETCPKLTLKRIPSNLVNKESRDIWTSSSVSFGMENNNREINPRKCIIKAQRYTLDGKLEYLLEWE